MNPGAFKTQLNDVERFLKTVGLLDFRVRVDYSKDLLAQVRDAPYDVQFGYMRRNNYFDFLLKDGSLIQFLRYEETIGPPTKKVTHVNLSYSLLVAPFSQDDFETYREAFADIPDMPEEEIRFHYEQESIKVAKAYVTPIRYDFTPQFYATGLHPASHFHFGENNEIRVGTKKVIEPLSFTLFICRQVYPTYWAKCLEHTNCLAWGKFIRESLGDVELLDLESNDRHELILQ